VEVILFRKGAEEVFELMKQGAYAHFSSPVDVGRLKETINTTANFFNHR